jgi:hypothetical protein
MALPLNLRLDDGLSDADKRAMPYFTNAAKDKIAQVMRDLLADFVKLGSSFVFDVSWGVSGEGLQLPNLVLIYFRANQGSTLTRQFTGASAPPTNAAGFTVAVNKVTLSEVYVEQNFPEDKMARIALHEMMHNRTETGDELHKSAIGGDGIASSPTQGWEHVTPRNAQIVSRSLLKKIPQFVRKWN